MISVRAMHTHRRVRGCQRVHMAVRTTTVDWSQMVGADSRAAPSTVVLSNEEACIPQRIWQNTIVGGTTVDGVELASVATKGWGGHRQLLEFVWSSFTEE